MEPEAIKDAIRKFLAKHQLGVIATVHANGTGTESACVNMTETENLEIIIGTSNKTRKYANIKAHPRVSMVIGWSHEIGTVQFEGDARELSADEATAVVPLVTAKNPEALKFVKPDEQVYFKITPTWIRILDIAGEKPGRYEVTF